MTGGRASTPLTEAPLTAVVTGAGSRRGIGRGTAHALAAAGWHVAALDVDGEGAATTAAEIMDAYGSSDLGSSDLGVSDLGVSDLGVGALGVACDVTDPASVDAALARVETELPPIGALVNNAGITSPTPFLDVTDEEWNRLIAVNLGGSYTVTRRLAPGMVERGFGRVVFVSSVSAERGGGVFGGVAYSAAKAALLGFARALARELGPAGVTVNAVAPGLIGTDITGDAFDGERGDAVIAAMPVRRIGRVEDVADLITFLCRPESGYVTGVTYDVNGGSHIA